MTRGAEIISMLLIGIPNAWATVTPWMKGREFHFSTCAAFMACSFTCQLATFSGLPQST